MIARVSSYTHNQSAVVYDKWYTVTRGKTDATQEPAISPHKMHYPMASHPQAQDVSVQGGHCRMNYRMLDNRHPVSL